jgi:hypothetical protein
MSAQREEIFRNVWWHVATLLFILIFSTTYINSITFLHCIHPSPFRRGSSPSPHHWSAQWEKPPLGALQQADAVPIEVRHTLTEFRCNLVTELYAAGFELHRTRARVNLNTQESKLYPQMVKISPGHPNLYVL